MAMSQIQLKVSYPSIADIPQLRASLSAAGRLDDLGLWHLSQALSSDSSLYPHLETGLLTFVTFPSHPADSEGRKRKGVVSGVQPSEQ